jgi:hypothetical protein
VPQRLVEGDQALVPFHAGELLGWRLAEG